PTAFNASFIAQTDPAGITQPPQTATSFYKIAENQMITIGWNMTSVIATLTSSSAFSAPTVTPTLAPTPTGHLPGMTTQVVWDVYSYQQARQNTPLAQATCTLHMWDDHGPTATERAGYMSPNTALTFALYTLQAHTPIASGWTCTGCKSAMGRRIQFCRPSFNRRHPFAFLVVSLNCER
ncbi:hypothetical protein C8R44DRAFT_608995, partial [Mycena epipterygia]